MAGLPLQGHLDDENPEEHFLWALVGLAGPQAQAPLLVPTGIMRKWSQHLYECGFRHHDELQTIKYVPPHGTDNWVMGAAGRWVPIEETLDAEDTVPNTDHLSVDEKRLLMQQLQSELDYTAEHAKPLDNHAIVKDATDE